MHKNHLSCYEIAINFDLAGSCRVGKLEWRIYYYEGRQGVYKEWRGRSKNMISKPTKEKLDKDIGEYVIAENQRLRIKEILKNHRF